MVWTTGLLMIAFGVVILFWGYPLFRVWFAIAGFLFGYDIGLIIGKVFMTGDVWPVVLSIGLGLFFGIFGFALYRLGAVLIGFFLGGALSILIFYSFEVDPSWWIFMIGAIPFGIFAAFFIKPYIKIASAINGAYMIMLAILSMATGDTPSILLSEEIPWYFYVGLVVLSVLGSVYQFRRYKGEELHTSSQQSNAQAPPPTAPTPPPAAPPTTPPPADTQ